MAKTRYVEHRTTQIFEIVRSLHFEIWVEFFAANCFRTFSIAIGASMRTSLVHLWPADPALTSTLVRNVPVVPRVNEKTATCEGHHCHCHCHQGHCHNCKSHKHGCQGVAITIMTKVTAITTFSIRCRNRNKRKDDATSNNTNGKDEGKPAMKETMRTMGITHRMLTTYQDISTTIYIFRALPNRPRCSPTLRCDYLSSMHFVPSRWADELSFDAEPDPLTGHVLRSMQEDLCQVHVDMCVVASACLIKLCSRAYGK